MEDILAYIIVFGLIIGGVSIWQLRNAKARPYMLSRQSFPGFLLILSIEKYEGKTKGFLIKTVFKSQLEPDHLWLEMINKKRETETIQLNNHLEIRGNTDVQNDKISRTYKTSFAGLTEVLKESQFKYSTFRIVVETTNGQKFKSHELALNKRWTIYRPDSGKYN